jgi:DNA mismatch endonuclease (patch repair protein)
MADFLSQAERSERMSRIRGKDTKPEIIVRKLLHAAGLRFRLHVPNLIGRPDIVLPRYESIVLVHGCFWHRHTGCPVATTPKSNKSFWRAKFEGNVKRDRRNRAKLRKLGWRVFTIWECQVSSSSKSRATVERVIKKLRG